MSVDIREINLTLLTAFKNSNFLIVGEKALQAANTTKLQSESLLESDQTISGIKSISNINVAPSIAQLDTILPATSVNDSDDSDINLITGTRSKAGRLNTVIGSGSPQAVGQSLATVTNVNASTYRNELKTIAVEDAKSSVNDIDNIIDKGVDNHVGLSNSISIFNTSFNNIIGTPTNSLLANCILNIQKGIFPIIDKVAPTISKPDKDEAVRLLLADRKREAAQLLEKNSTTLDATAIQESIEQVDISQKNILDAATEKAIGKKTVQDYDLTRQEKSWQGSSTPVRGEAPALESAPVVSTASATPPVVQAPPKIGAPTVAVPAPPPVVTTTEPSGGAGVVTETVKKPVRTNAYTFDIVGSKEELITEFRESTRDITEFVTHWTATFSNQNTTAEDVHKWHRDRGFDGCGYHYLILRDGKLQRGRPLNIKGAHAKKNGHNKFSIGIAFVGGFNCPTGTPNPENFTSADSFTEEQRNTYDMFVASFYVAFPSGQAWGHSDTDPGKIDPGFDVQQYAYNVHNKENVFTNGRQLASSLSSAQLEAATERVT